MSFKSTIKSVTKKIESLIKKEIKNKGLVDTGSLYDSIKATVKFSSDGFIITVEGNDYFEYLDEKHNILSDAFDSSKFKTIEDSLADAFAEQFTENL